MSPFRVILVFCFISCCGVAIIPKLSVDLLPTPLPNSIIVSYTVNGATPEITEAMATAPIENALSQVDGYKTIQSFSGHGLGHVEFSFSKNENMAMKRFEFAAALRMLFPKLDEAVSYPIVEARSSASASKKPLLIYSVNGHFSPYQIKQMLTDQFTKPLRQVAGVQEVQVLGANNMQLTVEFDGALLASRKIEIEKLRRTISDAASSLSLGKQITPSKQIFNLKAGLTISDITQLEYILIVDSTHTFRLKELAHVYWEEKKPSSYFRINGLNSVTLSIYADDKVNRVKLAETLREIMADSGKRLPPGYSIFLEHDDTEYLRNEIRKNYYRASLAFAILLVFIAFTYRKIKHIILLALSIIITLLFTLLLCWVFGITIHLYTLAGLSISFGMVVDNAILMLDHVHFKSKGNIIKSIAGATLTTIVALLLVFFLPEEERLNLTEFCLIVCLALGCSIPVSLFFVPAAYTYWGKANSLQQKISIPRLRKKVWLFKHYQNIIGHGARHKKKVLMVCLLAFGMPVFLLPSRWEGHPWYNKTIGNEHYQENVRPYVDKITGGALRLFVRHVYERSGYREPEKTKLYVYASLPTGHTLSDMDLVIRGMESYLKEVEGIDKFISHVYSGEDASITVHFKETFENGSLPYQLKSRLIAKSLDWGGVEWNIFGVGQGFSNASGENLPSFSVKMKGYNYDELERQAGLLAEKLLKHKRIQKVNTNERFEWGEKKSLQPTLAFAGNALALAGANPIEISRHLRDVSEKGSSLSVLIQNKQVSVVVKEKGSDAFSLFHATKQSFYAGNKYINLTGAAQVTNETVTGSIRREDRQYIRMVGFEYYGSYKFGEEFLRKALNEMKNEMPVGYTAEHQTYRWDWNKTKRQYGLLVLLFLGIYIVCVILFESLTKPLIVLAVIPVSFIGLFLTFGWFEFYFDQGGYAAFILLGGLTVNASIFILNEFKSRHKTNQVRNVTRAAFKKAVPILLTVLSTCVGLSPFLIGGQNEVFWFALAAGTVGGLLFSLVGVFFIGPVLMVTVKKK